jgi:hypothetical protein
VALSSNITSPTGLCVGSMHVRSTPGMENGKETWNKARSLLYSSVPTTWHIRWVMLQIIHESEPITWATMFLNHEPDRESLFKIHNAVSHRCKWKGTLVSESQLKWGSWAERLSRTDFFCLALVSSSVLRNGKLLQTALTLFLKKRNSFEIWRKQTREVMQAWHCWCQIVNFTYHGSTKKKLDLRG